MNHSLEKEETGDFRRNEKIASAFINRMISSAFFVFQQLDNDRVINSW
jgi:hypothetical protein